MATYYIDPVNGNDADDGLSWANAFLTLNGAEDEPVAADDTVYVGPGVYRELLTCDVSGGAGTPITYIADVTGEHTDQVGGVVRITGSDNDQTAARGNCIFAANRDYRTFRGFKSDITSSIMWRFDDGCTNIICEDCVYESQSGTQAIIRFEDAGQIDNIIRRCAFFGGGRGGAIYFTHSSEVDDSNTLIENCFIAGCQGTGVRTARVGDITVQNCLFYMSSTGVRVEAALTIGQTCPVNNSIFVYGGTAVQATAVAELPEDYNTFYGNIVDRNTVNVGGNSLTYPALLASPILHSGASQISGFKFPWWFGELSEWSQIAAITGSNEPTEDLRGIVRPTTAAKNSWGPAQFFDAERETGTVRTGSVSITLHDAGSHQIWVPVANESTTISVYVYREANYAGTNPRLVIKQPGQADDTTTDAAAASQWNELTTTLTPAADPPYVVVELQSLNTAVALAFDIFFDDLTVS